MAQDLAVAQDLAAARDRRWSVRGGSGGGSRWRSARLRGKLGIQRKWKLGIHQQRHQFQWQQCELLQRKRFEHQRKCNQQ